MKKRTFPILFAWAVAVLAAAPLTSAAPAPTPPAVFTFRTPTGTTFTVTDEGLSSIRNGVRELAHGGWAPFNAEGWFKDSGSNAVKTVPVREKTLSILDDRHARVRQSAGDVVCTTDYTFDGEDVTLSSRVENNHPTSPMNVTGFSGLNFTFDRPPDGLMPVQHYTYFQAHGVSLCHPSYWSPVGGSYATDDHVGVGVSPWNAGMTRTLILWDYADWNPDKREKLPQRNLIYFVVNPVPARGAATFDFKIRVSPNRDWKHLLEPYRDEFRSAYGLVQYKSDYRWVATDYLNRDQQAISPTNPYGFYEGARRIDRPEGAKAFCDTVI
ncbi:MAG: hypothetical protein M3Y56_10025, partial [Armatimonadota bacterium]|nr:hypothetical protein [Armatimonadota bacterium]